LSFFKFQISKKDFGDARRHQAEAGRTRQEREEHFAGKTRHQFDRQLF
jgi:hypothetical protein